MVDLSKLELIKKHLTEKLDLLRTNGNEPANLKDRLVLMREIDSVDTITESIHILSRNAEKIIQKYNCIEGI